MKKTTVKTSSPLVLLALACACGPVHKQIRPSEADIRAIRSLAVVIPEEGEFEVYNERTQATGTPAFLFGLVGAAVASSYNASKDEETAEDISQSIEPITCRAGVRRALEATLAASDRFEVAYFEESPSKAERKKFDGVFELTIHHCGFRLVDQERSEAAAFVEMSAVLEPTASRKAVWNDRETIVSHNRHHFSRIQSDPELARTEFEDALEQAGERMANSLLYP